MRVGVFGGSFDPIHLGHLILAEQCREQGKLDRIVFIPAARPPNKPDRQLTPFHHRVEMLTLALSGNPAFVIDELENDRSGPSFTIDTLAELTRRDPSTDPWLILGADSVVDFPRWFRPRDIVELAGLMVVGRPGWELPAETELRTQLDLPEAVPLRMIRIESPLIEISSRDVRSRNAAGRSLRYLVPPAVDAYIDDKRLYC